MSSKIIYTKTDEAPFLATYSFLPIVRRFVGSAGIEVETKDISLAARVLSQFPECLDLEVPDDLAELGRLVKTKEANVIKLPNISASIPQLKACIEELQSKGFAIPNYPENANTEEDQRVKSIYDKIKGSAVNPVLREGNSDRRAPRSVKNYAKKNPHSMGKWTNRSQTQVSTMKQGDFAHNEVSVCMTKDDNLSIKLIYGDNEIILKKDIKVLQGEVVDGTFMSVKALKDFFKEQIDKTLSLDLLFLCRDDPGMNVWIRS